MLKSNLRVPPAHRGDEVNPPHLLSKFIRALLHPLKAMRYIVRFVRSKLTGGFHLAMVLGDTPVYLVDIGAAGGINERWNQLGKNLRIALFEPEQISFNKLVEFFKLDNRVKCFGCALSDQGQQLNFHLARWPRASSVFLPSLEYVESNNIRDHYETVKILNIPSRRLVDVYTDTDLDFIKIDTEGFELPILKGSGSLLDSVIGLELEVFFQQVREGQPFFADVDIFCREHGFTFMYFKNINDSCHFLLPSTRLESEGYYGAGDAVYFRLPRHIIDLVKLGDWSTDKIYKAIALYLTFNQYEFAYVLLTTASQEHIIEPGEPRFAAAMRIIEDRSGYNRSFFYYIGLKALSKFS